MALLYLVTFLSGCAALVYQILWIRGLALVLGSTTASICTVVAAFMGGLALGSALIGRWVDRHGRLLRLYALLEVGIQQPRADTRRVEDGAVPLDAVVERQRLEERGLDDPEPSLAGAQVPEVVRAVDGRETPATDATESARRGDLLGELRVMEAARRTVPQRRATGDPNATSQRLLTRTCAQEPCRKA